MRTRAAVALEAGKPLVGCCQTNSNQSQLGQEACRLLSTKRPPLGKGNGSAALEIVPRVEVAFLIEVVEGPTTCRKRGQEIKIIAGDRTRKPDTTLIAALRKAHAWIAHIKDGRSIKDIANDEDCTDSYARRLIPLATLSPTIQMAILDGTHPPDLTLEGIIRKRLPIDWREQEMTLGFAR